MLENSHKKLTVFYFRDTDTLEVDNGESTHCSYAVAEGLTANLDADGEAAGFTLEKARELLLPHLSECDAVFAKSRLPDRPMIFSQDNSAASVRKMVGQNTRNKLRIGYFSETDTLDMWNEEGASFGWDVSETLVSFSIDYDGKEIKGFTLEHAAEILLPCLSGSSQTAPSSTSGD